MLVFVGGRWLRQLSDRTWVLYRAADLIDYCIFQNILRQITETQAPRARRYQDHEMRDLTLKRRKRPS
jgi:hypothetical protein